MKDDYVTLMKVHGIEPYVPPTEYDLARLSLRFTHPIIKKFDRLFRQVTYKPNVSFQWAVDRTGTEELIFIIYLVCHTLDEQNREA